MSVNQLQANRFYTGIGSRKAPQTILDIISQLSKKLNTELHCHTGDAKGCDFAFNNGNDNCTIFSCFENSQNNHINCTTLGNWTEAIKIASEYHPKFNSLSLVAKNLITRNTYQILGFDLNTPSSFVVCWTPDGATKTTTPETGGTGQVIRIANDYNIPVYNIQKNEHYNLIKHVVDGVITLN